MHTPEHSPINTAASERMLNATFSTKAERVRRSLMHNGASREEAEDCLQNAYIKLREYIRTRPLRPGGTYALLYNAALHLYLDEVRKQTRRRKIARSQLDSLPQPRSTHPEQLVQKYQLEAIFSLVYEVLATLPQVRQEVVYEAIMLKTPHIELYARFHVPTNTIGVWVSRAKDKIRLKLSEHGITSYPEALKNDRPA